MNARSPIYWILVLATLAGGCASVSREQEIAIGREARGQFEQEFGGLYDDRDVPAYVQDVGLSLASHAGRDDLPWEFRVLASDQVNAFALPGGLVYITRGLLFQLRNEAQLAAVLGHEIGHVEHRHSVRQLERARLLQGGAALAGLFGGEHSSAVGDIGQLVAGLAMMKYGRDQEREADLAALELMTGEALDPRAMIEVIKVLERTPAGNGPPEFLSSHPSPASREEYLRERIAEEYSPVVTRWRADREEFERRVLANAEPAAARRAPGAR